MAAIARELDQGRKLARDRDVFLKARPAWATRAEMACQAACTIDGVASIDTGNNGGSMVTTDIDSVAEFKILTNS